MRKSHKLLAVMMWLGSTQAYADTPLMLANGGPAAGNTIAKGTPKPRSQASRLESARAGLAQARTNLEVAVQYELALVQEFVTTPRVLANGAPACGNTMGKMPAEPCTQAPADAEQTQRFVAMQNAITQTRLAKVRVHEAVRTVEELRRSVEAEVAVASADVG